VVENPDLIDGAAWAREYRLQMEDLVRWVTEKIETKEIKEESVFFSFFRLVFYLVVFAVFWCSNFFFHIRTKSVFIFLFFRSFDIIDAFNALNSFLRRQNRPTKKLKSC
jgi:hypothetical protein